MTTPYHDPSLERLLHGALMPGEQILDATGGTIPVVRMGQATTRHGWLVVTDQRVVLFTKKLGGYDLQDFAYGLLSSVDHKRGVFTGDLHLAAAGDRSHVTGIPKRDVERIAKLIRARMAATDSGSLGGVPQVAEKSPAIDVSTEIRNLAALRDDGLVTQEEFEAKKKQLLGL